MFLYPLKGQTCHGFHNEIYTLNPAFVLIFDLHLESIFRVKVPLTTLKNLTFLSFRTETYELIVYF